MHLLDLKKDYHVHSNYNDHSPQELSIEKVTRYAEKIDLNTLAFTEHVRKTSDWIPRYLEEIDKIVSSGTKPTIISGFEAKILKDGTVDFPTEYEGHFLIASFHTRYNNKEDWLSALKSAIAIPYVNVIGHLAPEESFDLTDDELVELSQLLKLYYKTVEINAKYCRPPMKWLRIFKDNNVNFHLGSDAHNLDEVGNFNSISNLIEYVNY
ncbi:MAG: PHP domain-containing protein [Nitrosopumilales archaeon]|jgi:histidinol phosphatase-like PHP family hydrolase|nr:MAG: PHP domain-containing protein [Nitrosopumilales archaeon]